MTSNIQHFQHFIKREGYHESLTDTQQVDAYSRAYPGRITPLLADLIREHGEHAVLADGDASFWFYSVPEIVAWVERGVSPSEPLASILQNDLNGAVNHADAKVASHLYSIVHNLRLWLPPLCHGSKEAYHSWRGPEAIELRATVLKQSDARGWPEWKRQMQSKL